MNVKVLASALFLSSSVTMLTSCSDEPANIHTITFENVPASYLAGPTAYGANLYDGSYTGYLDKSTGLSFHTTTDGYYFSNGGVAISQWNNMTDASYTNQCSVYYGTSDASNGGCDHSKTFAVAYCSSFGESGAYMEFTDKAEHVINHAYFTNTTYAALSMLNGDAYSKKFSYDDRDWFKLTLTGVDANGNTTGTVEVYLADFRGASAPGVLTEWKYVDLTPLGKVNRVDFAMTSTDNGEYGMNTPSYFCMDNIAVEL